MGIPKPSAPGTMAKATGMMKAPNPMMAQGAVAKGASLAPPLAPLAPLSMPLAMPPFQVTEPIFGKLSCLCVVFQIFSLLVHVGSLSFSLDFFHSESRARVSSVSCFFVNFERGFRPRVACPAD